MAKPILNINCWNSDPVREQWREKAQRINSFRKNLGPDEYYSDMGRVFSRFLKNGDAAVEMFNFAVPDTLLLMRDRVGNKGKVYALDLWAHEIAEVVLNFATMYNAFQRQAWNEGRRYGGGLPLRHLQDNKLPDLLGSAIAACDMDGLRGLRADKAVDPRMSGEGKKWLKSVIHGMSDEKTGRRILEFTAPFFKTMGMDYRCAYLPMFPEIFRKGSIDFLFERNGFTFVEENLVEQILSRADMLLKRGGAMAFEEDGSRQAMMMYYGEEIFKNRYTQVHVPDLNSPYDWLVFRKD